MVEEVDVGAIDTDAVTKRWAARLPADDLDERLVDDLVEQARVSEQQIPRP